MKVLERGILGDDGKIILDPVGLPAILRNSKRGGAAGVLTNDALVISTISCTSHHDTAQPAGIEIKDFQVGDFDVTTKVARLQMGDDGFDVEVWLHDFWNEFKPQNYAVCPIPDEDLQRLEHWLRNHPKIRLAYGATVPQIEIHLKDEWQQSVRVFKDGLLHTPADLQLPVAEDEAPAVAI